MSTFAPRASVQWLVRGRELGFETWELTQTYIYETVGDGGSTALLLKNTTSYTVLSCDYSVIFQSFKGQNQ